MQSNSSLFRRTLLFKIANPIDDDEFESPPSPIPDQDPFDYLSEEDKEQAIDQSNLRRWGNKSDEELLKLIEQGYNNEITKLKSWWYDFPSIHQNPVLRAKLRLALEQEMRGEKPKIRLIPAGRDWLLSINSEEIARGIYKREALLRGVAAFWA